MKKNRIVISIFASVCVISTIVGYSLIKKDNNKYDQLAVMTQQDDGSYIRSTMSAFGNDDYEFDHAVCNNGTMVTANSNGGVNLTFLGTDKCTVYLKKKQSIVDLIKASAQPSTSSMFSKIEPTNEISSVTDDNFSKGQQTYTVDATHQSYYMTYASSYTFNTPDMISSGTNNPTYTLTSPQVRKYSDVYSSLAGKYIVNYEGHNSSTAAESYKIDRIYKVVRATATSITYIPSSYTMEFTNNGTTGVYTAEDENNTTSYYFRGNVTNNYVKFGKWTEEVYRGYNSKQTEYKEYFTKAECQADIAWNYGCNKSPVAGKDMYWRIVRINGDGSLRLMYDGTEAHTNGTKNYDRFALPYQQFNTNNNNNAYVGYMYGDINGTTYAAVHANTNSSAIKTALETWYEKNFVGTEYESKIGNMSFCNDRNRAPYFGTVGTGVGTTITYYGAYDRLSTNKTPSLICPQKENDLFTSNKTTLGGNGKLNKPIGLLTADEVALAGGVYHNSDTLNRGYYINKGYTQWLGSPHNYTSNYTYANGFAVNINGNATTSMVIGKNGAVPVINIPKEYAETMTGNGTMYNPYVVTGKLPDGYYSVSFDTRVSDDYIVPKIVKEGEPYGILPVIEKLSKEYAGHTFDGWYTEPYGKGDKITSSTIVTSSANNQVLYSWIRSTLEPQKPV